MFREVGAEKTTRFRRVLTNTYLPTYVVRTRKDALADLLPWKRGTKDASKFATIRYQTSITNSFHYATCEITHEPKCTLRHLPSSLHDILVYVVFSLILKYSDIHILPP